MRGIVFTPRPNAMESYEVKDFGEPLYQTIRDRIGGYMEVVRLSGSPYVFLVDEDGLNKDLEINAFASALSGTLIVGTVVLMKIGETEDGPDIVGLDDIETECFRVCLEHSGGLKEART